MNTNRVIRVRPARIVPLSLFVVAVTLGIVVSPWWLLSILCVAIGAVFTAPNLNLINGLPSYLCIVAGLVLWRFYPLAGIVVLAGIIASSYGSALEMRLFAQPYSPPSPEA